MPKQPAKKDLWINILAPIVALILLALASFNLHSYLADNQSSLVLAETTSLEEEVEFWNKFLENNPDYLPGWKEYVELNENLGNHIKSKKAIDKIEELDPNFDLEDLN